MEVNVSPDMGMYHLLRSQGYDPAYALAEFIDNALQAYLSVGKIESDPLKVDVHFYSSDHRDATKRNSIVIRDNGPGIPFERLADAMKPARPSPTKGLSEFGIGMKAAAVWFCDCWNLSTTPARSTATYNLTFDLPALMAAGKSTVDVDEIAEGGPSGTTITLTTLRRSVDFERFHQICGDLKDLYQRFTAGSMPRLKLTAHYNGTPTSLQYEPGDRTVLDVPVFKTVDKKVYAIGQSHVWSVPVDIIFAGARIEGFVQLLERGSYTDNPGLVMFRQDRVIQGTAHRPNLPAKLFRTGNKYSRQRVYGELFVDGLPVTYTKDGFEIDQDAFAEQLKAVPGMDALLRQAEEYRVKVIPKAVEKEADIPGQAGAKRKPDAKVDTGPMPAAAGVSIPTLAHGSAPSASTPAPSPAPAPAQSALVKLLTDLKALTLSTTLRAVIEETVLNHQFKRPISTALCLRTVLEKATMDKVERSFPDEYAKVSDKAIFSLLNYMNSNPSSFFDRKAQHNVLKCVQSLATGTQSDVMLLNNTAHGHYQPSLSEINRFVGNAEALLRWAVS